MINHKLSYFIVNAKAMDLASANWAIKFNGRTQLAPCVNVPEMLWTWPVIQALDILPDTRFRYSYDSWLLKLVQNLQWEPMNSTKLADTPKMVNLCGILVS